MAVLRNVVTREVRPVPARMLVGRSPSCSLRLDAKHVSGEHASLLWTGEGWEIRDLGSRNGTFVAGERVPAGEGHPVARGARLGFGVPDDVWIFEDDGPPQILAEEVNSGQVVTSRGGLLLLPTDREPQVSVYRARDGAWLAEDEEGGTRVLEDQAVVQAGGSVWRIRVPASQDGTASVDGGPTIDSIRLRFAVSRDEEHVMITVVHRGLEIPLEPREHGYVLLTLARLRLKEASLPDSEQGWTDRDALLKMLGADANALNVSIYRARGQLSDAGVEGAAGVVEVRRGQRRIGLPVEHLSVVPL